MVIIQNAPIYAFLMFIRTSPLQNPSTSQAKHILLSHDCRCLLQGKALRSHTRSYQLAVTCSCPFPNNIASCTCWQGGIVCLAFLQFCHLFWGKFSEVLIVHINSCRSPTSYTSVLPKNTASHTSWWALSHCQGYKYANPWFGQQIWKVIAAVRWPMSSAGQLHN